MKKIKLTHLQIGWRIKRALALILRQSSANTAQVGGARKSQRNLIKPPERTFFRRNANHTIQTKSTNSIILDLLTTHPRVFLGGRSKETIMVIEEILYAFSKHPYWNRMGTLYGNTSILPTDILSQLNNNKFSLVYHHRIINNIC